MKKREVVSKMKQAGIAGEVSGRGSNWSVELASEKVMNEFIARVTPAGGFRTGYGAWVLQPNYLSKGNWNEKSSRWHY